MSDHESEPEVKDKRKATSRTNAEKARLTKLKNAEQRKRLQEEKIKQKLIEEMKQEVSSESESDEEVIVYKPSKRKVQQKPSKKEPVHDYADEISLLKKQIAELSNNKKSIKNEDLLEELKLLKTELSKKPKDEVMSHPCKSILNF